MSAIQRIVDFARSQKRDVLLETEGMEILQALGVSVPARVRVSGSSDVVDLGAFPGERVVVKVVSDEILHKSDVGGVEIVSRTPEAVRSSIAAMEARFKGRYRVDGYSINQFVAYDRSLGGEFLVGVRQTEDFGPVVTVGAGGIYTEFLSEQFRPGRDVAILSPATIDPSDHAAIESALSEVAIVRLATCGLRGQKPRVAMRAVVAVVSKFLAFARDYVPSVFSEFEVNPMVALDGELYALDALGKLGTPVPGQVAKPVHKIDQLLHPKSIGIIGVGSDPLNPGRIILGNMLFQGFPADNVAVIKPGTDAIDGCRCYPDLASVSGTLDLLILVVSAAQVPGIVTEATEKRKAESIIVIPGGLEEKSGTEAIVARMREALLAARTSEWQGPVINGGNCLGIRSMPGRYNTFFIPEFKLPLPSGQVAPIALISQSGAFGISRLNKISGLNPKYALSVGNQMDLTVGDYLAYLKDDREISLHAVYVEGFKPGDGLKFLQSARSITERGGTVILYRAGRTAAGAQASASHTASIAGNYPVTRELCRQAGVVLADTIEDFEDLVKLYSYLGTPRSGRRLAAVSNAGFECVAMADRLGSFELCEFSPETHSRLACVFKNARISEIVDIHNPLDLTPMSNDAAYEETVHAVLEDTGVDAAIVGCVPLTPAIQALEKDPAVHREDLAAENAIGPRLARVRASSAKPWVAVVDGGEIYDGLVRYLESAQIPVFRTADRALRIFGIYLSQDR